MIAVDTNVVVRLLTADDPQQFRRSKQLFENESIFIPDTVILESESVLRFAYEFTAAEVNRGLRGLFGLPNVNIANPAAAAMALDWHKTGLDFSDALHLALAHKCDRLLTFDKKFVKTSKEVTSIAVVFPPE
ncbi:MAG: type II toxin-antitoxin system VapC family toxin [Candidatus Promineifilaceae bacterium]|nr:type II toxin-antitoxin system VapC family toxin [Candidatus Promineifilaceae bacterium]